MENSRIQLTDKFSGGSLIVEIDISYNELVRILGGEPNRETDGYKTDAEWAVLFDGTPFYIYNYKTGKNYLGAEGLPTNKIRDWHIGGEDAVKGHELAAYILSQKNKKQKSQPPKKKKTMALILEEVNKKDNEFCLDLVAYNEKGNKAVAIFDNAKTEKQFLMVTMRKTKGNWKQVSYEKMNRQDGIDMMVSASTFLNHLG